MEGRPKAVLITETPKKTALLVSVNCLISRIDRPPVINVGEDGKDIDIPEIHEKEGGVHFLLTSLYSLRSVSRRNISRAQ